MALRLGPRVKVGVVLHALVNLAFAARALALPGPVPELGAVQPAVEGAPVVVALAPATTAPPAPVAAAPDPSPAPAARTVRAAKQASTTATTLLVLRTTPASTTPSSARPVDVDRSPARFDRLAQCESDGDPAAVNGPYRGAFQFLLSTWHSAGGEGDPVDAPYERQRDVAITWSRVVDPASQWPVCWPLTA
jgi:hypothetical protein